MFSVGKSFSGKVGSTLSSGLFYGSLRHNYSFQMVIILLIVLGGLGFTVILNGLTCIRCWLRQVYNRLLYRRATPIRLSTLSFNSRLALGTTFMLLTLGALVFLLFEYRYSFKAHPTVAGKIVSALFAAVTPRTAGFNTVDMSALSLPSILFIILLMWIGASPASTGGGIRTTTFAVAFLNIRSIAKGEDRTTIFHREISDSVKRAFAIIALSLAVISISAFLLAITDGDKEPLSLMFECFSAYSTVGLTLGITPELSPMGRLVIIFAMFTGRVGSLTLLIALVRRFKVTSYRYPEEHVVF